MAMSVTYTTFNGQIVYENRGGVESYYAPDTLGSTAALLNASGVVTDTFTYQPYGEIASHVGSSVTPFTYCGTLGYYTDTANSSIYVRARYYRPNLARWQTVDLVWPEELAYGYGFSCPTSYVDPSGNSPCQHDPYIAATCNARCLAEGLYWTGKSRIVQVGNDAIIYCTCGPDCPKPTISPSAAWQNSSQLVLANFGKCKLISTNKASKATSCAIPGTGTHQVKIYQCGKKKVSASVTCCPCGTGATDTSGSTCQASMPHIARF